jgi:hypothetical protein
MKPWLKPGDLREDPGVDFMGFFDNNRWGSLNNLPLIIIKNGINVGKTELLNWHYWASRKMTSPNWTKSECIQDVMYMQASGKPWESSWILKTKPRTVCCKDSRNLMAFHEVASCIIFHNMLPMLTQIIGSSMSMTSSAMPWYVKVMQEPGPPPSWVHHPLLDRPTEMTFRRRPSHGKIGE